MANESILTQQDGILNGISPLLLLLLALIFFSNRRCGCGCGW